MEAGSTLWGAVRIATPAVMLAVTIYGAQRMRDVLSAASDARGSGRYMALHTLAVVSSVRWVVNLGVFAAAILVDEWCEPTADNRNHCVQILILAIVTAALLAVVTEWTGRRAVKRHTRSVSDDPPPRVLHPVEGTDDGPRGGPLA